jgi:hypothetical protein
LARYRGPSKHLPDYGYAFNNSGGLVLEKPLTEYLYSPPAVQTAVTIALGKDKTMAGEKKVVHTPSLAQQITDRLIG